MSPQYPQRIANWCLQECLGSGFSGAIYRACNVHTDQVAAIKIQDVDHECPTNRYERGFYPSLQGGLGMPTLWASGIQGQWDYLVIDLLGASLDSLFRKSGKKVMDLRSVCCIAMQVISRLEFMHTRGILHRDIQLGNCVVGLKDHAQTIYMIDFGFSKRYIDPRTNRHIPDSKAKRDFIGNYWFTSVGVHCKGRVPSRRDDLEALALMLIHLLTPNGLSWTRNGVPKTDIAHTRLMREKQNARPEDLCKGLPSEFEEFLRYCRKLKFSECPDYEHWRNEFRELATAQGYPDDDAFVWPPPVQEAKVRVTTHGRASLPGKPDQIKDLLNGIARLNLGDRPVLGNRANIPSLTLAQPAAAEKKLTRHQTEDVIVISSDSETENIQSEGDPANLRMQLPKAAHFAALARHVPDATDSIALSRLVREFLDVLTASRSRTLTKEAFQFLDALHQQLADPDKFVQPLRRSSRKHSQLTSADEGKHVDDRAARRAKTDILFRLKREVLKVGNGREMAGLVAEFGSCIDQSKGRTVTKDALGFLEGLAVGMRSLQA